MTPARPTPPKAARQYPALFYGLVFGAALGLGWAAYHTADGLLTLSDFWLKTLNNAAVSAVFVITGLCGARAAYTTGRARAGALAGFLAGLTGALISFGATEILTFAFPEALKRNPRLLEDFSRSGAADLDTFLYEDLLTAGAVLLVHQPLIGALMGTAFGFAAKRRLLRKKLREARRARTGK